MSLETLLHRASRPNPVVSEAQALAWLHEHYGIEGSLHDLGSQQDLNFRVETGERRFVLKICHGDYAVLELQAQHAAMAHLSRAGIPAPGVIPSLAGEAIVAVELSGAHLQIRLLDYIEGQPLTRLKHLGSDLMAAIGQLCARVDEALATLEHPGLERTLQWDPRHAHEVIAQLLPLVPEPGQRDRVTGVVAQAHHRLQGLHAALPVQAVHLDISDDNSVWQRDSDLRWQLNGLIDFGDVLRTWRIADLSVTCAALLHHADGDPFAVLPVVVAYHAHTPLSEAELQALWPMVVMRAAILVLSSAQQLAINPDNAYIQANVEHEWEIFEIATAQPFELMEAAVLSSVGHEGTGDTLGIGKNSSGTDNNRDDGRLPIFSDLDPEKIVSVDLGVLSQHFVSGNWEQADIDERLLAQAAEQSGWAYAPYGQYRLSQTRIDSAQAPDTFALHVQLHVPCDSVVRAPFAAILRIDDAAGLVLEGACFCVHLQGVTTELAHGTALAAGERLGLASGAVRVQTCRSSALTPPLFTTANRAGAWQRLCPSPRVVLGFDCEAPPLADAQALLARREASFARSQKHYYQAPPQIERGWRNHLIDMQGRAYLDMLNNVAVLGHGHPRMATEAARQWSLLNTNSRFHYAAIAEYSERLLALAPPGFDRVFLVNSGTEANDLAIRLAWAFSGGRDMLSVLEAYHGWSVATDAISTSIADNPQALSTRPDWVHPVTAPNTYRGAWRGADSAPHYVRDVTRTLARLAEQGRQVAGFICEPVYGNAGGIALPTGYLQQVYAQVRAQGGVCIADEVQVGYGRLGDCFWGFEEQGVVPDIITMAKGMGNGHPLGAVITRREIAEALEAEGYFFSSAGGSPVSCRIGMAVLDVMAQERLWENARVVGGHFKARLQALVDLHPLVGAVHGSGFYLGVELVRDRAILEPATEETALLCERLRELGIFMQPTGDYLNILKIKPPMVTTRQSVDFFVDSVSKVLFEMQI
jgi:4-aminobutyrate aminotransferase-like enzyme/Ser/Thr protein kinase RdoA (MazF antagonist)